jgi:Rod binding domain-containing protein
MNAAQQGMDLGLIKADAAKTSASPVGKRLSEREARKAGADFEAMFLGQMINHMSAGLKTDKTFGGGHGETAFRSLLNEEYARQMVKSGSVGVADAITRELLRQQEVRRP